MYGHTRELLLFSIARPVPEKDEDWFWYYVNIFCDRDMMMRFHSGGIGHKSTRSATDTFLDNLNTLDRQDDLGMTKTVADDDQEGGNEHTVPDDDKEALSDPDEEDDFGYGGLAEWLDDEANEVDDVDDCEPEEDDLGAEDGEGAGDDGEVDMEVLFVFFYTGPARIVDDTLELHVHSPAFDEECTPTPLTTAVDHSSLWKNDSFSISSVESSPHEVPKLEAYLYYFGLQGPRRRGPKFIFRTSKNVFIAPLEPEQEPRHMKLQPVYAHNILSEGDLWPTIRSKISRPVVTTPVTIWVGVLPNTLTGEVEFQSSNDISNLLKDHGISDVDVAYREAAANGSNGPELFAPVSDFDPHKAAIDPVTTTLSLPIVGFKTFYTQGPMGFYFKLGQDLPKEVVLMGTKAFHNFLMSIQGHVGVMNSTVGVLEKRVMALTARLKGDGPTAEQEARALEETQRELTKTREAIEELKNFLVKMKKQWTRLKDQVIGHVVLAPPVSVHTAPHSYMVDVCVVKPDKKKFLQNLRGNVLHLGSEIDPAKFISLMHPPIDAPSDFDYPAAAIRWKQQSSPLIPSPVRPFSMYGDSGSIIVDALGKFVALLTGGTGPTDSSDIMSGTPMHWLWDVIKTRFPGASLYFEDDNNQPNVKTLARRLTSFVSTAAPPLLTPRSLSLCDSFSFLGTLLSIDRLLAQAGALTVERLFRFVSLPFRPFILITNIVARALASRTSVCSCDLFSAILPFFLSATSF
ncbi:hypothetical protein BKA82DRAFT_23219 [Pisolithus tinctorius]|uniref:Uncharacterized protein n=1 Tax=Pisolithus tinctorius Marx 270 TaxID=870435 RepID=A0A0C3PIM3_PISTI|nr:hypothetical protein BKA82DRAFT_23219 [Pisolithus tinctorius]KIO07959.1 hypothetical protein M404DRAFT_23219 [Pisolithus tinctorius Marx 270]